MTPGTIISGTLRNQDLIPAFLDAIKDTPEYEQMMFAPFPPIPSYVMEDDNNEWWDSESATFLLDKLFEILEWHAPANHFFGAHPGDGSDFGYWPIEE